MMLSYCIVDDDAVSRRMLQTIIENGGLGEVIATAGSGTDGTRAVLDAHPDVVLIDLLMPDQDGIETIIRLKREGYAGKYVMISQIENKEMIGKAYQAGIEYYIQKPINRIEVEAVLSRVGEQWKIGRYLQEIKESLAKLDIIGSPDRSAGKKKPSVREVVQPILMDLGVIGDAGSRDIVEIIDYLVQVHKSEALPSLKELYEVAARAHKPDGTTDTDKEGKAVEQRIRRAVLSALNHLASIGLTDYGNPKFEHYAPLYFDFQDVRLKMKEIDENKTQDKGKVNIKKFLQVLYLQTLDKIRE
ncbi:response regulator [Paenibacillus doosanensis]|uniref:Chemotaxis protein CheY n=1 Tax=Paenibacillus konkukensis TaxID=2020716 RepID=A0ABY4RUJ6_9BACL|nr:MULTISPECIES: response regulator [Paenibacillus]MCS7461044.1 response regulator [Paenibacillus doosanensis]UQZ85718.1 Chemotaxis protein CheY [Paenibacillus konkukensis]